MIVLNGADGVNEIVAKVMAQGAAGLGLARTLLAKASTREASTQETSAREPSQNGTPKTAALE